jgi:hypothetical protein
MPEDIFKSVRALLPKWQSDRVTYPLEDTRASVAFLAVKACEEELRAALTIAEQLRSAEVEPLDNAQMARSEALRVAKRVLSSGTAFSTGAVPALELVKVAKYILKGTPDA